MANKPSDVCPLGRTPGNFKHAEVSNAWKTNPVMCARLGVLRGRKSRDVCPFGRTPGLFPACLFSKNNMGISCGCCCIAQQSKHVVMSPPPCGPIVKSVLYVKQRENVSVVGANGRRLSYQIYEMYETHIKFPSHENIIPSKFHRNFYEISKHIRYTVEIS